ncbi:hypothetical protein K0K20_004435 [Salmonella enterica]|uniref:hypothetical protein n=1 Tax=Salmonella enterica TaxID=28901 RepID=UPI001DEE4941|nr:hypothetical protein [Salmonella enterica]EHE0413675.1 hypothetical protein [Salmonella enterica subsp. enterica serovar Infantis]HDT6138214.1 hypothetical protein [Escherichia coli]EBH1281326.1 hypothetical protein [Salmonella enterica]EGV9049734.1 hypothetical protein [Salmonella enterica]
MNNRINKVPYSSSGDNKPTLPKTDKVKFYHEDEYAFAHFMYDDTAAEQDNAETKSENNND